MGQRQDGGLRERGLGEGRADAWPRAPFRCTPTCCRAARPTPWPPTPKRGSVSCQSLSAGLSDWNSGNFRRLHHFRSARPELSSIVRFSARRPHSIAPPSPAARAQAERRLWLARFVGAPVRREIWLCVVGIPDSPNLPGVAWGPGPAGLFLSGGLGPATNALFCWPPARWKSLLGKPSAVKRRKRCRGCGKGWLRFWLPSQDFRLVFASFDRPRAAVTSNLHFSLEWGDTGSESVGERHAPLVAFKEQIFFTAEMQKYKT